MMRPLIMGLLGAGVALAAVVVVSRATAQAAPYVSCPGGYIAKSLGDCPPLQKHTVPQSPPVGGGPHGRGGLLGLGIGGIL